jgi:prepilin-type N-terminal cleavage/methylation domain-containing protein
MKSRAFTLIEILLTIAIIALVAALIFPVIAKGKKSAFTASCTEQLRQIGIATELYLAESDAFPPTLDALVETRCLDDARLLLCPSDPFQETTMKSYSGQLFYRCPGYRYPNLKLIHEQSYVSLFPYFKLPYLVDAMERADSNHGLVVCRLHGAPTDRFALAMQGEKEFCEHAWWMTEGTLLRLRKDGSVQRAQLRFRPLDSGFGLSIWNLYTDAPQPKSFH